MKSIKLKELKAGDTFTLKMQLHNRVALIVESITDKKVCCIIKDSKETKEIPLKGGGTCFLLNRD